MNVRHSLGPDRWAERRSWSPRERRGQNAGVIQRGANEQRLVVGVAQDDVAFAEQAESCCLMLGPVVVTRERRIHAEMLPECRMVADS